MTAQEELDMLEDAYESILTGKVQSYAVAGQQVTRLNLEFIVRRMDALRAAVARAANGGVFVARMRDPE